MNATRWRLPDSVASVTEVIRLQREIADIDGLLAQAALRKAGEPKLPPVSSILEELAAQNKANLLLATHRSRIAKFLDELREKAPLLHFSFAANPSQAFTEKLVSWVRQKIHPYALLQIGLQPSIAAGCVLRTENKYFDLSLRKDIEQKKDLLLEKLKVAQ